MIGFWRSHSVFQSNLIDSMKHFFTYIPERVVAFASSLTKVYLFDFDPIRSYLEDIYPSFGRPSNQVPEILRSFFLMLDQKETSITKWVKKLSSDSFLATLVGCSVDSVPSIGAHYALIDHLWLESPSVFLNASKKMRLPTSKPKVKKKLKQNQKFESNKKRAVESIAEFALANRSLKSRPELLLQKLFSLCVVNKSDDLGLIPSSDNLILSADGTCFESFSSPYGTKDCDCKSKGIYKCDCSRRFSDPDARWGWDSYEEKWFLGHTIFTSCCHNSSLKLDLPLYLRVVQAQRHDSASALFALSEFRELYPNFKLGYFLFDSAADNYPTYNLLNHWNVKPIIALNNRAKGTGKLPQPSTISDAGVPSCSGGHTMINWGFCKDRNRIKWRCPLVTNHICSCDSADSCSKSAYGRVIYTKPSDDPRLFTVIPRNSKAWWNLYKERTACERVNKRILHDYNISSLRSRGKKRLSFFTTFASANIHADAWIKTQNFNFLNLIK